MDTKITKAEKDCRLVTLRNAKLVLGDSIFSVVAGNTNLQYEEDKKSGVPGTTMMPTKFLKIEAKTVFSQKLVKDVNGTIFTSINESDDKTQSKPQILIPVEPGKDKSLFPNPTPSVIADSIEKDRKVYFKDGAALAAAVDVMNEAAMTSIENAIKRLNSELELLSSVRASNKEVISNNG